MSWTRSYFACLVFVTNSFHSNAFFSDHLSELKDDAKELNGGWRNENLEFQQKLSSKDQIPHIMWPNKVIDKFWKPWRQVFSTARKVISRTSSVSADGQSNSDKQSEEAKAFLWAGPEGGQVHMGPWSNMTKRRDCPPMFVVVMSKRDSLEKRDKIRDMWQHASEDWGGNVEARFGICSRIPSDENSSVEQLVRKEEKQFNDLLLMDCDEGYLGGLLTLKTMAAMTAYLTKPRNNTLFMKTDDDTFAALPRLCQYISDSAGNAYGRLKHSYIGVFAEDGERIEKKTPPCRDPESDWFEPWDNFNREYWPVCAKGGPGYILSQKLVYDIMKDGIAAANVLNNEDKAVGVWVDKLAQHYPYKIEYMNLPGTDGYIQYHDNIKTYGAWDYYPYVLHHHLDGAEIKCLHSLQTKGDLEARIDDCFTVHKAVQGPKATRMSKAHPMKAKTQTLFTRRGNNVEVDKNQEAQDPRDLFEWKREKHFLDHMSQAEFLSCMGVS